MPDPKDELVLELAVTAGCDSVVTTEPGSFDQVPEIWLYRQNRLSIQWLQDGQYVDGLNSRAFPMVSVEQLNQWIELRKTETDLTVLREVQRYITENNDCNSF